MASAFHDSAHNEASGTGATLANADALNVTANDLVDLTIGSEGPTAGYSISEINDGQGNTLTGGQITLAAALLNHSNGDLRAARYKFKATTTGTLTITVTWGAARTFRSITAVSVTPSAGTLLVVDDASAQAQGSSASPSAGAGTSSTTSGFAIASVRTYGGRTATQGSGWTLPAELATLTDGGHAEHRVVSATGSITGDMTLDAGNEFVAHLVIYKEQASGTPTVGQVQENDLAQPISGVNYDQAEDLFLFGDNTGDESSFGGLKLFGGFPAAGATLSVAQVSESDSAQPITARHVLTVAQVFESDAAQVVSPAQARTVGQAAENDAPQPITGQLARVAGQASEADSAQPVTARLLLTVAQTSETDLAQPIDRRLVQTVAQAQESNLAQAITARLVRSVDQALETDSAQAITLGSTGLGVAQVEESDAAQPVQGLIRIAVAQAAESDASQPIAVKIVGGVGQAGESDASQPITARVARTVAQALETDAAQQVFPGGFLPMDQASEVESAQPISARLAVNVAQSVETDQAMAFTPGIAAQVGQVSELEAAQAFVSRLLQSVGMVEEIDTAGAVQEPGAPVPEQPGSGTGGIGRLVTPSYRMQPPRRKRRVEEGQPVGTAVHVAPGPLAGTAPAAAASTTGATPAQPERAAPADRWRLAREQDLEFETQVLHHI